MAGEWVGVIEAAATAASVLVAIGFGVSAARASRRQQREIHTLNLLSVSFSDKVLQEAASLVYDISKTGAKPPVLGSDHDFHFRSLLSYYHYLSVAAANDLINVDILMKQKGAAMTRAVAALSDWIAAQRTALGDDAYMQGLEQFVGKKIASHLRREMRGSEHSVMRYASE